MMPLGDQLRADDDIDAALFDVAEFLAHALDRSDEIAGEHHDAPVGKQRRGFLLEPLDAGPARHEGIGCLALWARGRRRRREAAMMADKLVLEAVIDQPSVAVRAIEPKAAGAAERERRIAAAVQEQQCLLAALQRGLDDAGEARGDKTA